MNLRDRTLAASIQLLRFYTVYSPLEKGRWRIAAMTHACIAHLSEGSLMTIKARDGRRFLIDPREPQYQMGLLDLGMFEPAETRAVSAQVKPGFTIVDAGANFGWYTTLFSRLTGPGGQVHAFEPMPPAADVLETNCELNRCENVTINRCALGERAEAGVLFHTRGKACGDVSLFPSSEASKLPYHCEIITLDAYANRQGLSRCDLIKCDVEGAELAVLRGATAILREHRPSVLLEINPPALQRAGCTGRDVLEELNRYGKYIFHRVDASISGNAVIEPTDCDDVRTYINVLCLPTIDRR